MVKELQNPANKRVEALLFAAPQPLSIKKIAKILQMDTAVLEKTIENLNQFYEQNDRAFRIYLTLKGYQMRPQPEFSNLLGKVDEFKKQQLNARSLETLSIIAYQQPITKADIENIRSVDCSYAIQTLIEKQLIRICGRSDLPGRPLLYGTSKFFLEVFGFRSINDLPKNHELGWQPEENSP